MSTNDQKLQHHQKARAKKQRQRTKKMFSHSSEVVSKNFILHANMPLIAKKGFITKPSYYEITSKLQELGQNLTDNCDMFYQYASCLLKTFRQNNNVDGQITVYIRMSSVEYYRNNLGKAEEAVENAVVLARLSENNKYFLGRSAYLVSAIARKANRLEHAFRAIERGKEELQNVQPGEDTAKLLFNEARQEMEQATMLERFDHVIRRRIRDKLNEEIEQDKMMKMLDRVTRRRIRDKLYKSILHYKREPPGHHDNDIRRCWLNMAQTMLGWPTSLKGKYNTNITEEDITEAERYIRIIKEQFNSDRIATKRNKQHLMFTESGLHYRKKEYNQAVKLATEAKEMAEHSELKAEVRSCTEFLNFLIPLQKAAVKKLTTSTKAISAWGRSGIDRRLETKTDVTSD